jgi:rSAM/selenodomain-associated transferase 1
MADAGSQAAPSVVPADRRDGRAGADRRALVIVGKAPKAGRTKTRLSPPLSPTEAAELYRGFLQDTAAMAVRLGWERVTLIHPAESGASGALGSLLPQSITLQSQTGVGLGAALADAFRTHLAEGFRRVVLVGSDNPTLPAEIVVRAAEALSKCDLAIGPSADGGYYLIGMSRPHLGVFERITWSTSVVLGETLERARELGLSVEVLPEWYDVDTADDLAHLQADLARLPPRVAPATRSVLAALGDSLGQRV